MRAGGGQLPVDGDGLLGDRQRVGRAAQRREPDAEVVQRAGEVGAVAVRAGGGQLPADGDGLLGDGQRVGRAAQLREPDAEAVQRVGEVGAVAVGLAAASSRYMATASSVTGSASAGRPSSEKRTPRLFRERARSGR